MVSIATDSVAGSYLDRRGLEIKSSATPKLTQGFYEAMKVINPEKAFVVAMVDASWPLKPDIMVHPLSEALNAIHFN